MKKVFSAIYHRLYSSFGPQHWWPAETPFEIIIGAILTQNTNWLNVEKAICNLKKKNLLAPAKLYNLAQAKLAALIVPAGYYNIKAKRVKNFLSFFMHTYGGSIKKMSLLDTQFLRTQLLSVNGIGPETADSILLYALKKPIFVIDAYTRRILCRHKLAKEDYGYEELQNLFMHNLRKDVKLFNEYHALLVRLGKIICFKNKPKCDVCCLNRI